MRTSLARRVAGVIALVFVQLSVPGSVMAAPPVVVAPKVENIPSPDVSAPGAEEVTVELELTVDAQGGVADARVLSAPNGSLDASALRALEAAKFTPATRDGEPVAVRIRYAMVFKPAPPLGAPPTAVPITPTAPNGSDAPNDATSQAAETSRKIPDAPAAANEAAPSEDQATFGARAVTDAPAREVTVRSMTAQELGAMGTRGDPIRAVELLPSFARTSLGQPLPIIRGSASYESEVFFEGMPVPLLYHFGGLTSFVPARVLDRVDFYPGNFSARYGRNLGGIIDVRARDPASDGAHGVLDASFIDASVFAEGPLVSDRRRPGAEPEPSSTQLSAAVGFRRSYVDAFFKSIASSDNVSIDTAPVYYDYQGILAARFGERHKARFFVYGSQDSLALVLSKPDDTDPLIRGKFDVKTAFHRVQGDVKSTLSSRVSQELSFAVGTEQYRQKAGAIADQDFHAFTMRGRAEWIFKPSAETRLTFGIDHVSQNWFGSYEGIRPQIEGATNLPPSVARRIAPATLDAWVHSPAVYVEPAFLLGERVTVIPSVRADYQSQLAALTLDPRLAVRARAGATTVLKAGVGKFTQHPQVWQAYPESGNVDLEPGWALHVSTGVEQAIGTAMRIGVEGFAKSLHDLPVATRNYTAPYFDNQGRGQIYGLELEARVLPTSPVYGLIAYTLSRSERARKDEALRLFDNDQTHVGSASAVARLGRGWQAGATFRATSANPSTPVVGAVYDARTDTYSARYGALNSGRAPLYHRLDLHLEKTWTFTAWKLMAYVDIQNVYNATNAESAAYNYDYTKSKGSASFPPFFPSLGLRGEL